ncbi:DUF2946 family protein [Paracandidimonas lactea]|uniref:DUF2946 family protein n=1 Tax=Paracandidimonas lactea TaxID=2895524 RepID=UPI001F38C5C0|nr:DUF2946 family protein [Paracandidimonas lactea]
MAHPSHSSRPVLRRARPALWLLALAILLRGLMPLGYMPDLTAIRSGELRITICSVGMPPGALAAQDAGPLAHMSRPAEAAGMLVHVTGAKYHITTETASEAGNDHGSDRGNHHANGSLECPFSLLTHLAAIAGAATPSVQPLAMAAVLPLRPAAFAEPVVNILRGPPLGSRAPPISLFA